MFPNFLCFERSQWRRLGVWLGAIVLFLVGCGMDRPTPPLSSQSAKPIVVSILMNADDANRMRSLEAAFDDTHPGVDLQLIEGPVAPNLREDLYTSAFILGDSPYDLVYMDSVWTPKFAAAGWLLDLSDRVSPQQLSQFLPVDIDAGRYEGRLYRMPMRSDVGILYYRSDWLAQAGYVPPETFAELLDIAQSLQQTQEVPWGYLWQGKQYEGLSAMFVEVLRGHGGFWIDPDTNQVGLDRPEAIAAVEFLLRTIEQGISPEGVVTYGEPETLRFFLNGQTVFLRNWPYVWGEANKEGSPLQGNIAIKAMVHVPGETGSGCQGGWGFGIAKTTPHPDAAWQVIDFLTSASSQKQYTLENSYVPTRRSLFTDPDIVAQYPHYPQLLEILEQAVNRPPTPQYAQISDILQRYLSSALTKRLTPEAAMSAAARETRQLLGAGT